MPDNITFEQASTMPTVFVTVDVALNRTLNIKSKDKVLIHGAAGGVGLAAMQVIAAAGAVPVVTAGNVSKREMLRGIGANCTVNSRSPSFAEDMLVCSQGATSVINTLTSPGFVAATLSTLARGGGFVEISKRDIWCTERMLQERPDIDYNLLAVDFMSAQAIHNALMRVSDGVARSKLFPLPLISHNMASIIDALRQMSQARHIGKIVVRPLLLQSSIELGQSLVTGGTGALGSLVTKWLMDQKSGYVTISARTGAYRTSPEFAKLHRNLLTIMKSDTSIFADVQAFRGEASQHFSSLFHAGGVLSDATIYNQSATSIRQVFAPKTQGANNIDSFMAYEPFQLRFFFSSMASLLGSIGQMNYSAANSWLDSLADADQLMGIMTVSAQFGAWKSGGMASETSSKMEAMGLGALSAKSGMSSLSAVLKSIAWSTPEHAKANIAISPIDWPKFLENTKDEVPFFFDLYKQQKWTTDSMLGVTNASISRPTIAIDAQKIQAEVEEVAWSIIGGEVGPEETAHGSWS
eukprot:jgi/Picre1/29095/NNA_004488.t1